MTTTEKKYQTNPNQKHQKVLFFLYKHSYIAVAHTRPLSITWHRYSLSLKNHMALREFIFKESNGTARVYLKDHMAQLEFI